MANPVHIAPVSPIGFLDFWIAVSEGLVASVLYTILLLVAGSIIYLLRRRSLRNFFGITNAREFNIYLSHLHIPTGGAHDVQGIKRSYSGRAVDLGETMEARNVQNLFSFLVPQASSLPDVANTVHLSDVTCSVLISPEHTNQVNRNKSFLALGSPGYNTASRLIQEHLWTGCGFSSNNDVIHLPHHGEIRADNNCNIAFVARLRYGSAWCFYAAGFTRQGTCAAARFLTQQWLTLHRDFGLQAFIVVLDASHSAHHGYPKVLNQYAFDPVKDVPYKKPKSGP